MRGRAVPVHRAFGLTPSLTARGFQRLNRKYDELLSNVAFNCKLRPYSVAFMTDGGSIISGWSDGKIRAFAPQSGRLLYTINDAHSAVTAIIATNDCTRIISGGIEGNVRVWRVGPQSQTMVASMKEHKGPVNSIALRRNDSECVSASSDGSCIIWDLTRFARNNSLFASTFFKVGRCRLTPGFHR